MKAIAIGLLAAASIALSAPANAHIWVDGRGWVPGWGVGDYWLMIGATSARWRYYRVPCQVARDGSGRWWITRCM